jgi:single-strand DNA-binding protein
MQQLTIAGNVGKDAELRRTGNGDAVLGFSVAVDNGKDKNGNKRDSTWFDCSIWGKRAESLERYITKGTKVVLTGRPTAREHNGKAYLGISVNDLTFMGGNSQGGNEPRQDNYQAPEQPAQQGFDDEIPF